MSGERYKVVRSRCPECGGIITARHGSPRSDSIASSLLLGLRLSCDKCCGFDSEDRARETKLARKPVQP